MNKRKLKLLLFYFFYLWIIFEIGFRIAFSINYKAPFFKPSKVIYNYYPELLQEYDFSAEYNILMLGASVFEDVRGDIRGKLGAFLKNEIPQKNINIINISRPGHTSRDSRIKLDLFKELDQVDQVIFYHSINEVKANCSPDDVFQKDYSHYSKYDEIGKIFRHKECNITVIPLYLDLLWSQISGKETLEKYYKKEKKKYDWNDFGYKIKTAKSFEENLESVIQNCKKAGAELLIPEYVYYLPEDYHKSRKDSLYTKTKFIVPPVEIWGNPDHVQKGIRAHNKIAKELAAKHQIRHVPTNDRFPRERAYFNDICHLTDKGTAEFVKLVGPAVEQIVLATAKNPGGSN